MQYVNWIQKGMKQNLPCRFLITNTLDLWCYIESFSWGYNQVGDIEYTLKLKEYRE